jgi:hypothetical protein
MIISSCHLYFLKNKFNSYLLYKSLFVNSVSAQCLHCLEALLKVPDDIIDMLRSDGKADGAPTDACRRKLYFLL